MWKVCRRKKPYDTEFEAEIAASKANELALHENIHAYKCPVCKNWHIGHQRLQGKKIVETIPGQLRCARCGQIVARRNRVAHKFNKRWCVEYNTN